MGHRVQQIYRKGLWNSLLDNPLVWILEKSVNKWVNKFLDKQSSDLSPQQLVWRWWNLRCLVISSYPFTMLSQTHLCSLNSNYRLRAFPNLVKYGMYYEVGMSLLRYQHESNILIQYEQKWKKNNIFYFSTDVHFILTKCVLFTMITTNRNYKVLLNGLCGQNEIVTCRLRPKVSLAP